MTERARSEAIAGVITGASVSHRRTDVTTIEAVSVADPSATLQELQDRDGVREAFILQTCNRAERYVVTPNAELGRQSLASWLDGAPDGAAVLFDHDEAIEHLLRVGAGLESMVVGEDEVLGQLRRARDTAKRAGTLEQLLGDVTAKALHVGQRVRTETAINDGTRSLSRAAVDLAAERVSLGSASVAVIGAGEMGERVARACCDHEVERLEILNRTPTRAVELADELPIPTEAHGLEALVSALERVDVAIAATASPEPVVTADRVLDVAPVLLVDIGQPRDVAPAVGERPGIEHVDLDDLESVLETTSARRRAAERDAVAIVEAERERLHAQLKRQQADHAIAAMYEQAERIKAQELAEARAKLEAAEDLDAERAAVLEGLADALVGKLMAAPTKSLREAAEDDDWETIQTALGLFDPEFPTGEVDPDTARMPTRDEVPSESS